MIWTPLLTNIIIPEYELTADTDNDIWVGYYISSSPVWFAFFYEGSPYIASALMASFSASGHFAGTAVATGEWVNGKGIYESDSFVLFWSTVYKAWCIMDRLPSSGEPEEKTNEEGEPDGDCFWSSSDLPNIGEITHFKPRGAAKNNDLEVELKAQWDLAKLDPACVQLEFPAGKYKHDNGSETIIGIDLNANEDFGGDPLYMLNPRYEHKYLFEVATWK